jgi:hypothetical protein
VINLDSNRVEDAKVYQKRRTATMVVVDNLRPEKTFGPDVQTHGHGFLRMVLTVFTETFRFQLSSLVSELLSENFLHLGPRVFRRRELHKFWMILSVFKNKISFQF